MGFADACSRWSDAKCLEHFVDWDAPACDGIELAYLRAHGYARPALGMPDERAPHREGNFPTPSGKCELLSATAAEGNFVVAAFRQMYAAAQPGEPPDTLPDYVPPRESAASNPELAAKYPLSIISPKSHEFLNSYYANEPCKRERQGDQFVLVSESDATNRGISDGDRVRVFNGRGAFEGRARVSDDVNPGLLVTTVGYWRQLSSGTVNAISSAEFVNMGHAATFSDNLVELERVT